MNIQPASTVLRRIYVSPVFFGIFGEERAMHIAGICWPAIWKSSRRWSTRMDFCWGWAASQVLPGFCEIFVLKLQRKNGSCQCKKSTGIVNCHHEKTNYKFPGTWSSQIIFTESFLMPNTLSWGLLGKIPKSLAINGDPQNCVTWGGFQCGGPNSEDFCSAFFAKLLP